MKNLNNAMWTLQGGRTICPAPFCLAGILNVTPDSFSSAGASLPAQADLVQQAGSMLAAASLFAEHTTSASACASMPPSTQGTLNTPSNQLVPPTTVSQGLPSPEPCTVMLDLGAESTRPGSVFVDAAEEAQRLLPVLAAIRQAYPMAIISVDTCRASVAQQALEMGAHIINDVSACSRDTALLDVVAAHKPGYVLTHGGREHWTNTGCTLAPGMHTEARYTTLLDTLIRFFEEKMTTCIKAGLPESHIVLDPGIGFGKTGKENWAILRDIERLNILGRPVYMGLSRKSLFKHLLDLPVSERDGVTQTATALLAAKGVRYHRVHDVAATARALRVTYAITM